MRGLRACGRLLLQAPGVGSPLSSRRCSRQAAAPPAPAPDHRRYSPPLHRWIRRGLQNWSTCTHALPCCLVAIAAPAPGPSPPGSEWVPSPSSGGSPAPAEATAEGDGEGHSINYWILGGLLVALAAVLLLGLHQQLRWWRRRSAAGSSGAAAAAAPLAGAGEEGVGWTGHALALLLNARYRCALSRPLAPPSHPPPPPCAPLLVQAAARRRSRPPCRPCAWPR